MKKENRFYLIFISTILTLRLWVYLFPLRKIIINGAIIHHFWIGILLLIVTLLLQKRYNNIGIVEILFPISLGIISDELVYILIGGNTVSEYWSVYSVCGVAALSIMTFVLKDKFMKFFYKE